jgi:hypothetical protein
MRRKPKITNQKVHCCVHKRPPLVPILSRCNPLNRFLPNFFKILSNIMPPSTLRFYKWIFPLSQISLPKFRTHTFTPLCMLRVPPIQVFLILLPGEEFRVWDFLYIIGIYCSKLSVFIRLKFGLTWGPNYIFEAREVNGGRDSSVGIATGYRLDGLGIESRWGGPRFSTPLQTDHGAHPAPYKMGTGYLSGGKAAGAWRWPSISI